MAKTLEQLLSLSSIIANETKAGANTALRIGGLFSDIIYYLRDLDYAGKDDIPSLDGYATEQWVLGKGYATTSDLDNRIDALVNGAPQAYDTLKEIADVLANNINSIDDILTALGTKVSKDDFNTAIANVNTAIDSLNTELGLKLDAVTFNELFEKVQLEDGTWAIKAKLGLFSDGFISAKGSNVGGTSSEGGAVALYQLNDVLADGTGVSGATDGAVFVYDGKLGKWKGIAQSEIVPNLTGYATESWVLQQGFLTQHQDLSDYAKLTDIPTIPTTDINKGVTAYGWGDHSKVGYLTGITSALVTGALGYTPYNAANFTKANIKSTLGISDWALASSKPSYTTKEVAEDTNLYFTNARAVAALKSITDGLQSDIDTKLDASVFSELFEKVTLEDGVTAIRAKYGLFTDYFLSAKGANSSGGSSSDGGLITSLYRYADLGKTFADTNNDTFNAYTINKINSDLGSRISVLEGKATNVSFTQSLTSGTQIGSISIDGVTKNIYAPTIPTDDINKGVTAYGWGNHATMGYITASASITGNAASASLIKPTTGTGVASSWVSLTSYTKVWGEAFNVSSLGSDTGDIALYLRSGVYTKNSAELCVAIDGDFYAQTGSKKVLHEGNYTDYTYSKTTIDSTLSGYQTKITSSNKLAYSLISGTPTSLPASDVYAWAKAATKPSYAFSEITNKPTTLSGFGITDAYTKSQDDSALGGYLPLSGGTITSNNLRIGASNNYQSANLLIVNNTSGTANYGTSIRHYYDNVYQGLLIYPNYGLYYSDNGTEYPLIHSGNIGSQSVLSAEKLVDASGAELVTTNDRTLYVGGGTYTSRDTHILGSGVRLRYGASAAVGLLLNTSGNVLIGTTTDSGYKLHVKSTATALMCESTASESSIYFSASSENAYRWAIGKGVWSIGGDFGIGEYNTAKKIFFRIAKDGNVGIGLSWTTAPSYKLDVNGTLHASDAVSFGSTLDVTGAITKPTTSGSNMTSNYISAGGGFSSGTGKYGVKILCCDQADAQTGLGQDLGGFPGGYELSVVGGTSSAGQGYISFVTHGVNSTSYRKLGYFYDNKGVISFDVLGTIHSTTGIWSDGYVSAKGQNTSSDMRLKNVLNEVALSVKDIANAPSIRFSWKNGGGIDVGSSAQYWQKLLPDAVKERDGMLEMQYANIALLSAIALAKNFETHEERIARLEKENKELRNEISMMKGCIYE